MQQCQSAISNQQPFTLHLLHGRPSSEATHRLIIAHFKPAGTEHLNSNAPLVGVPGQVEWKSGEADHLYFVTVQKDEDPGERSVLQHKCMPFMQHTWYLTYHAHDYCNTHTSQARSHI